MLLFQLLKLHMCRDALRVVVCVSKPERNSSANTKLLLTVVLPFHSWTSTRTTLSQPHNAGSQELRVESKTLYYDFLQVACDFLQVLVRGFSATQAF